MRQLSDYELVQATRALRRILDGAMFLPGEECYDIERLSWNLGIDPRPAIVAEAAGPRDIRAAVLVARAHGLPFAVQGTGHGTIVPADGGLLLKTSLLCDVEVNPERCTARVGAGALWSDVIAAAAPFGLAPVSGTASIGVVGYTLGGGVGWLSRRYGFAADSVLRAEVVTADGRSVVASAEENPDLFWALRGGGPGFGVVTELDFRLYPVAEVYAGMALYPIDRAGEVLRRYRDWAATEPDDVTTAVTLLRMPAAPHLPEALRGRRMLAIRALSLAGPEPLRPLLAAAGEPVSGSFGTMSFADTTAITGPPPPPMATVQCFDFVDELSDGLLDVLLEAEPAAVELRHWGGAMARPGPDAGPAGHRDAPFSVMAVAPYEVAGGRTVAMSSMDSLTARLRPFVNGGTFLNFLTDAERTESAFTAANYRRLAQIKADWDPDNFFSVGHAIAGAPAAALSAVN
jgi:hypothetical protein